MFLGYSILQLLEYLVTAVVTRLEKFHGVLSKQTADCKQERNSTSQAKDKTQDTISNEKMIVVELNWISKHYEESALIGKKNLKS